MQKIFFLLLITSCNPFVNDWDMRPSNAVDKVLNKHENNYVKNLKIGAIVSENGGGGCFGINLITIGLSTEKVLTIDIARKIIIDGLLDLQCEINLSNELKKYLATWPIPLENLQYSIHRRINGIWYKYPGGFQNNEITFARFMNNKISYKIDLFEDKMPEKVYEETLQEAIEKLGYKNNYILDEIINIL